MSLLHTDKLQSFSENLPKEALDLYPTSAPCPTTDRCPERAYTTMVSDIRVTCPNNDLAWRAAGKLIKRSCCFKSAVKNSVTVLLLSPPAGVLAGCQLNSPDLKQINDW